MFDNRRSPRAGAVCPLAWTAVLLTSALLQACSPNTNAPNPSRLRVYAADVQGEAKACSVSDTSPTVNQATPAAMQVGNDGGWCGMLLHQPGPKPYDVGLLTKRPAHGTVLIHQVGDDTRIDYTPDRAFSGNDTFSVKLIPGNAILNFAVSVSAPPAQTGKS